MAVALEPQEVPGAPDRAWPAVLAPVALIVGFFMATVGGLVVGVVGTIGGASLSHPPPVVSLIATFIQDATLVLSAIFFAAQIARPRPEQFGLRPTAIRRAAVAVTVAYAAFLVFAAVWVAALQIRDKEKILQQLGADKSTVALLGVCLLTCVIAPVCEEFFFRGFFFTSLQSWWRPWPAAAITGIVFGAIHFGSAPVGYLVPLAFFGAALCLVYRRTGSLYPCIVLHALNNSVAFGITEHWGWQIPVLVASSMAAIGLALAAVARLTSPQ